jgi:hypothetical protein
VRNLRAICVFVPLCGAIALTAALAYGQSAPPTLGSFLGIGADQQSSNPAIQAAAKAKAAKHQICKKKKALQYLAGMGCSPEHPEVGAALLAAMSDPDEPVRYEAVKAVLQTAGECQSPEQKKATRKALGCCESLCDAKKKLDKKFCDCLERLCGKAPPKEHKKLKEMVKRKDDAACDPKADCPQGNGKGPCCSPEMRAKLQELAYGRDDKGCFLESSSRVRTVAEQALQACNACNGCNCDPSNRGSAGARELPPVEERETAGYNGIFPPDGDLPGRCGVTDEALPMSDHPIPLPETEPVPMAPEPPAVEQIPSPAPDCEPLVMPEQALRSVLRPSVERIACQPSSGPDGSQRHFAVLPPCPATASGQTPPVATTQSATLTWATITEALRESRVCETWLRPEDRADPQAAFTTMVGESVSTRLPQPTSAHEHRSPQAPVCNPAPIACQAARPARQQPAERLACLPPPNGTTMTSRHTVLPPRAPPGGVAAPQLSAAQPRSVPPARSADATNTALGRPASCPPENCKPQPAPVAVTAEARPAKASAAPSRPRTRAWMGTLVAAAGCLLVLLLATFLGGPPETRHTATDVSPLVTARRLAAAAAADRRAA